MSNYCIYRNGGSECETIAPLKIEIKRLTKFCTHAGILKAQEEHNRMMGEKEAEILLLKSIICRHLKYYPATDVLVIRNDMPPMTVDMRRMLVQVLEEREGEG